MLELIFIIFFQFHLQHFHSRDISKNKIRLIFQILETFTSTNFVCHLLLFYDVLFSFALPTFLIYIRRTQCHYIPLSVYIFPQFLILLLNTDFQFLNSCFKIHPAARCFLLSSLNVVRKFKNHRYHFRRIIKRNIRHFEHFHRFMETSMSIRNCK